MNKYFVFTFGAVLCWLVGITACVGKEASAPPRVEKVDGWILPEGVSEFFLQDGTRCVRFDDVGGGSVTCDWDYQQQSCSR